MSRGFATPGVGRFSLKACFIRTTPKALADRRGRDRRLQPWRPAIGGCAGPLDALLSEIAAVGGRLPILIDGGVRRGVDIVKALALGASGCLVGRAFAYGLGAGGGAGVQGALAILAPEFDNALALLGVNSPAEIGGACGKPQLGAVMSWTLRYAPHLGFRSFDAPLFLASAGSADPLAQVDFAAANGFAGVQDPWFVSRPPALQEAIVARLAERGLAAGSVVFAGTRETIRTPLWTCRAEDRERCRACSQRRSTRRAALARNRSLC